MTSRPCSGSKTLTALGKSESGWHHRHNSSNPCHNRSDLGHSLSFNLGERKHGHCHSKSEGCEKETEKESNTTGLSNRLDVYSNLHSDNNHHTRPTSLHSPKINDSGIIGHDTFQPEREPICFDVALVGAPPEVEQLVNNIKQVAEQFLYHWKTFPISK